MTSLTINNVSKSYGSVPAIKNVSIDVSDGEFLVLVGPSGCGKSTLLRMIAGLEILGDGHILLGERDVSHVDPKDRDVAMVFQNYALYPHMTVYDNMAFSLQQRKMPKDEIDSIILKSAKTLDLLDLLGRKPGELSGGQRQRVAMGRAIVRNPAIYLMDEPLSNLDAKLRVQMRAELKLLRERLGVTTVYVTHDQVEAMTLGDRVAVLAPCDPDSPTNLQQVDTPQKLYHEPRNLFVAGFIGSPAMNFFYVQIKQQNNELTAAMENTDVELPLNSHHLCHNNVLNTYLDKRIIMGIRPEFFSLDTQTDDATTISVDVLVQEIVGADAYLHFNIDTPIVSSAFQNNDTESHTEETATARFTARTLSEQLSSDTGHVTLRIDIPKLHFFDCDSGDRITG